MPALLSAHGTEYELKSFRLLGSAILALVLCGTLLLPQLAEAAGKIPSNVPALGLLLEENSEIFGMPDVAIAWINQSDNTQNLICSSVDDKICDDAVSVNIFQHLPVCSVDSSYACISEVWAIDSSGKKTDGVYVKALPANSKYDREPIPSMNLSAVRGIGGVWKIPGVGNSGGEDNYFVSVRNDIWVEKRSGTSLRTQKINSLNISAAISPVQEVAGEYAPRKAVDKRDPNGAGGAGSSGSNSTPSKERCVVTDTGICEVVRDFPAGYRFGLSLRLGDKLSGWFHGRIALPQIATKPWRNGVELSVEADPVNISTLDFLVPNAQIPDEIRKIISEREIGNANTSAGTQIVENLSNPETIKIMNAFLPAIGDKATKTTGYWSFTALNSWNEPSIQRCSDGTGNLAGIVTTNALLYSAGPPSFNKETGSLTYKVASPHFEANGTVATGTYDLVLKSEVARCIYGFSKAPIQAEVSITSSDGEKKVATTVVNEKNGWLYLSANGFTFSSPIINVKLTQAKVEVLPKQITITCIKGKITKKVTGASPKCPIGYKKK
jgi:hypothetical protein